MHGRMVEVASETEEARRRADAIVRRLIEIECPTLEPFLPLMFRLNGKPYTLTRHKPFSAAFQTRVPREQTFLCARQVGKTQYMAVRGLTTAAMNPYSIQLFVSPLYEQTRRFSSNYVAPLVAEAAIKPILVNASCNQSVLQRTFINKAAMLFGYAGLSVNRLRGVGGVWALYYDEIQDLLAEHINVVNETMSAAPDPWGLRTNTGTPKGFDNPAEEMWASSSRAAWFIKCRVGGCGHWNICSVEHDLMKMIGPVSDDIGPNRPGTVCAKCQKPIDPATGNWKHRDESLKWLHRGFHVPQPIMPMHYANPIRWATLVGKMHGKGGMSPAMFQNEVLGESCDIGAKLLTKSQLQAACVLPPNEPRKIPERVKALRDNYKATVLAVDWGGGGGVSIGGNSTTRRISFTTVAYLGIRHGDGRIDVLWGRRLLTPNDHAREAADILGFFRELRPTVLVHDFTGAGVIRETLMLQSGVPADKILGFDYKFAPTSEIIQYVSGVDSGQRPHYRVDKTRTLLTTINAIRFGAVRFFEFDDKGPDDRGLVSDFLSLTEEKVETASGDRYLIRRAPGQSDDFAQAVNIGCCAIWRATGSWPDFVHQAGRSPDYLRDKLPV